MGIQSNFDYAHMVVLQWVVSVRIAKLGPADHFFVPVGFICSSNYPPVNLHRPWQIGVGRLVSIKNWWSPTHKGPLFKASTRDPGSDVSDENNPSDHTSLFFRRLIRCI